jgi:hypothetical protein
VGILRHFWVLSQMRSLPLYTRMDGGTNRGTLVMQSFYTIHETTHKAQIIYCRKNMTTVDWIQRMLAIIRFRTFFLPLSVQKTWRFILPIVLYDAKLGLSLWGRNIDWGVLGTECWGGYLDLKGRKTDHGEICITISFILHWILLGWGRGGRDFWNAWGRGEVFTGL